MAKSTKRKPARASAPTAGTGTIPPNASARGPDLINNPPFSTLPDLDLPEADPSQTGADVRPLAGETRPGEPTKKEIYDAAMNKPCDKHVVVFDGVRYGLVELTGMNSDVYIDTIMPQLERAMKTVLEGLSPLYAAVVRSYSMLSNLLRGNAIANLLEIARTDDLVELDAALRVLGAENPPIEDVTALQGAARSGQSVEFILSLLLIFGKGLGGPAFEALKELSFSTIISKLSHSLEDLTLASLTSSLKRQGIAHDREALKEKLDLMSRFDQFDVVYQQLEHMRERGTLGRFFVQVLGFTTTNTNTATPSASTTSITPS